MLLHTLAIWIIFLRLSFSCKGSCIKLRYISFATGEEQLSKTQLQSSAISDPMPTFICLLIISESNYKKIEIPGCVFFVLL